MNYEQENISNGVTIIDNEPIEYDGEKIEIPVTTIQEDL